MPATRGCPFTNFGPCDQKKCIFFVDGGCMFFLIAHSASFAATHSYFAAVSKPSDPYAMLFSGLRYETLAERKRTIENLLESVRSVEALPHIPKEAIQRISDNLKDLEHYLEAVTTALAEAAPRRGRAARAPGE